MNVGDYVRTEEGIKRVGNYYYKDAYDNGHCIYFEGNDFGLLYTNEKFKNMKSSSNIIDLIEVGDIVKYKIDNEEFISEVWGYKNNCFVQNFDVPIDLIDLNIVSIVTKEQFESMEYKVGD